mmetsp:Transcript_16205/g.34384  ORF Transcript_16205/g.34384 Transcript_16205/m.34384 type:complete len:213 (-) Transcript_16205:609-1247(-)
MPVHLVRGLDVPLRSRRLGTGLDAVVGNGAVGVVDAGMHRMVHSGGRLRRRLAGKAGLMRADVGNVGSRAGNGAVAGLGEMPGGGMLHCGRVFGAPVARAVLRPVRGGNALCARHSVRCNRVLNGGGLGGGGFLLRRPNLLGNFREMGKLPGSLLGRLLALNMGLHFGPLLLFLQAITLVLVELVLTVSHLLRPLLVSSDVHWSPMRNRHFG